MNFETEAERLAYEAGRADGIAETWACVGAVVDLMPRTTLGASDVAPMRALADRIATLPDRTVLRVLRPFDPHDALTAQQAAARAMVGESTIRDWTERYGIGRKKGGRLWISRTALDAFASDDARALTAYLKGDRQSPLLLPYAAPAPSFSGQSKTLDPSILT